MLKRAREQALREKREMKQAKKDARAEARLSGVEEDGDAADDAGEDEPAEAQ